MRRRFVNIILASFALAATLSACSERLQCPAYTSYFILDNTNSPRLTQELHASTNDLFPDPSYIIHDNPIRDQYFSYMGEDSMPRTDIADVRKTQFGIVERKSIRRRTNDLGLIPMEVVIPQTDDSLRFAGDRQLATEMDVQDSLAIDTAAVKTYKYNVDQKHYNWYFRNKLVWKDELEAQQEESQGELSEDGGADQQEAPASEGEEKGFFKRLFKKKPKEVDPAVDEPPVEEEEEEQDGFGPRSP